MQGAQVGLHIFILGAFLAPSVFDYNLFDIVMLRTHLSGHGNRAHSDRRSRAVEVHCSGLYRDRLITRTGQLDQIMNVRREGL